MLACSLRVQWLCCVGLGLLCLSAVYREPLAFVGVGCELGVVVVGVRVTVSFRVGMEVVFG